MEILQNIFEFVIHLDSHLEIIISQIGVWSYLLLFTIIFAETGLVIMPFLPGDSLLFVAGALAGKGMMNIALLFLILASAAILGDTINYWLGSWIGAKAFDGRFRFLKPEHLERTHQFFEKHGGKAVILGRFVPVMRTFVPFVAGMGSMNYGRFISYNILGGVLWVSIFLLGGYFFGSIPFVQDNFALVIIVVIALSVMPVVWEVLNEKVILPRHPRLHEDQTLS
ncbi:MAG: DedA family protein [Chloroflexota bacterium]